MAEFKLQIDGMHCGACVRRVTQALASVEGVKVNEVSVGAAQFTASQGQSIWRLPPWPKQVLPRIWRPDPIDG